MAASETIVSAIDARAEALAQLARKIHANPELRFEEKQASTWLADTVEQAGIAVERGVRRTLRVVGGDPDFQSHRQPARPFP